MDGERSLEPRHDIETERSLCFDLAAYAFASDVLDITAYESLAGEIAVAERFAELELIRARLPEPQLPPPERRQLVSAISSVVKRSGRWVESSLVRLEAKSSTVVLDFSAYHSDRDLRVTLDLDCRSTTLRIVVPGNVEVIDALESSAMSSVRNKAKPSEPGNIIVVRGGLTSSVVKIKRKKI